MKNGKRSRILPILFLLFLLFLVGSFLVLGLINSNISLKGIIAIKNETMYVIITLAILLIISLIVLMIFLIAQSEKFKMMKRYGVGLDVKGNVINKFDNLSINAKDSNINGSISGNVSSIDNDNESSDRFYMLSNIDKEYEYQISYDYNDDISLKEICDSFRYFAASRLKLYYSELDIRRFISSLGVSHIIILQGMSGTGKTSLAYAFGEFIKNTSTVVPIQPMWKERTDMLGYYNEFTKKFNETILLSKIYESNYNDQIYITVLDEMNIARVEYYFAEFLSLLELPNLENRYLDVVSDEWESDPKLLKNGQVKLKNNMYFIGTANNDDSTFAISDKVYDRAMIMNLDNKTTSFLCEDKEPVRFSHSHFDSLVNEAFKEYRVTRRTLNKLKKLDEYMISVFHITFGNRIMKQIKQYIPLFISCGGSELEALDDILSRKVLRKLEALNPVYVRKVSNDFLLTLDSIFGVNKMKLCKEYINVLVRTS